MCECFAVGFQQKLIASSFTNLWSWWPKPRSNCLAAGHHGLSKAWGHRLFFSTTVVDSSETISEIFQNKSVLTHIISIFLIDKIYSFDVKHYKFWAYVIRTRLIDESK